MIWCELLHDKELGGPARQQLNEVVRQTGAALHQFGINEDIDDLESVVRGARARHPNAAVKVQTTTLLGYGVAFMYWISADEPRDPAMTKVKEWLAKVNEALTVKPSNWEVKDFT